MRWCACTCNAWGWCSLLVVAVLILLWIVGVRFRLLSKLNHSRDGRQENLAGWLSVGPGTFKALGNGVLLLYCCKNRGWRNLLGFCWDSVTVSSAVTGFEKSSGFLRLLHASLGVTGRSKVRKRGGFLLCYAAFFLKELKASRGPAVCASSCH